MSLEGGGDCVLPCRPYGDLSNYFPTVTLHFEDADMVLPPANYLFVKDDVSAPEATRCMPSRPRLPPLERASMHRAASLGCLCDHLPGAVEGATTGLRQRLKWPSPLVLFDTDCWK